MSGAFGLVKSEKKRDIITSIQDISDGFFGEMADSAVPSRLQR